MKQVDSAAKIPKLIDALVVVVSVLCIAAQQNTQTQALRAQAAINATKVAMHGTFEFAIGTGIQPGRAAPQGR